VKKLLFIINVDWYYRLHWEERILSEMTDGFEVHLCMAQDAEQPADNDQRPTSFGERRITYHDIPMHRTSTGLATNFRSFQALRRIVAEVDPDLIHTVTIKPNILGGFLALRGCRPIVLTLPGLGTVFSAPSFKNRIIRSIILGLYRWISRNPNSHFVFENEDDRRLFENTGVLSAEQGEVSPGAGVDIEKYRVAQRLCPLQPLVVLFAARLLHQKGLDDLIDAVKALRQEERDVDLLVAGIEDPAAPDAILPEVIQRWHEAGDIHWLGRVDDMIGLLDRVHLIALPTKYGEGIPRILIEAAACGLPVVTTDVPGCRDFVVDGITGRLVIPGDVPGLAGALRELADEELRTRWGTAARRRVEENYSRAHVIRTFQRIYEARINPACAKDGS
jgi:glycosyltransferase involved in cell wall biosynthesis